MSKFIFIKGIFKIRKYKLKCEKHDYCNIRIPENTTLEYTKHNNRNRMPFVINVDFESINDSVLLTLHDVANRSLITLQYPLKGRILKGRQ
jgi:hypothetical protein